jgi:hypothetical protein
MSELAVFNPTQLPAFARKGELSDLARSLAGGSTSTMKRISTKGGVFRLIAGGKEVAAIDDRHLDVIIVQAAPKISRTYYSGTYEEGSASAPNCWSADGEKPDASVEEPQCSNCASCPQNAKGSGQGDSRACRFSQRLAVVLANDVHGDVMQLNLAATSIFGKEEGDKRPLQAYARYLAAQSISPEMLVTRLRFDTKAAVPKLFFQPVRYLTEDEYPVAIEKGQTEEAKRAVTMTVAQTDGVKKEKPLQLEGKKPVAKAEPVEAAEAAEVDEPEKRKAPAKANAVPEKKANLTELVGQWDTDD